MTLATHDRILTAVDIAFGRVTLTVRHGVTIGWYHRWF